MKPLKYSATRCDSVLLVIRISIAPRERSNFRFHGNKLQYL